MQTTSLIVAMVMIAMAAVLIDNHSIGMALWGLGVGVFNAGVFVLSLNKK
jgi:hypothetical protein